MPQEEIGAILGSGGAVGTAAAAAASVVLAPALEELVYRGFLLPSLSRQLPTAAAVSALQKRLCNYVATCHGQYLQIFCIAGNGFGW